MNWPWFEFNFSSTMNTTWLVEEAPKVFTWNEYILFFLCLAVSVAIGIYHGCTGDRQSSPNNYMFAKKQMAALPVAISIVSSVSSGVQTLGVPAEVYLFGLGYWVHAFMTLVALFVAYKLFVPVFHENQLRSVYEYLKLRFDDRVYQLSSFLSILVRFLVLPIVMYSPALAVAQCTGFNVHHVTPFLCIVCTFYTTIGGLKTVIWTDALQFISMSVTVFCVLYLGVQRAGGIANVYNSSLHGDRLSVSFDPDPTTHNTFWGLTFGTFCLLIFIYSLDQCSMQKFLALPDLKSTRRSFILVGFLVFFFLSLNVIAGLILYASYQNCDPVTSKKVAVPDQLLVYFVLDVADKFSGLSGLFLAGLFNASLSTLSAYLNSLCCLIYVDFLSKRLPKDLSKQRSTLILKLLVLLLGLAVTGLVYVVEQVGTLIPIYYSILGVTSGTEVGVFALGMLVPSATPEGAFWGALISCATVLWIMIGAQYYRINKQILPNFKPLSTVDCPSYNSTLWSLNRTSSFIVPPENTRNQPFFVYRLSPYYYPLIGFLIVFLVGLPISFWGKKQESKVKETLLSPVIRKHPVRSRSEDVPLRNGKNEEWSRRKSTITAQIGLLNP